MLESTRTPIVPLLRLAGVWPTALVRVSVLVQGVADECPL